MDKATKGGYTAMKPIWILILIALIAGIMFWSVGGSEITDEAPYYIKKVIGETATVTVKNTAINAEVARSDSARAKGLSGRSKLADGKGMLFVFTEASVYPFTMKEMLFYIDIIWINDNKIAFMEQSAQPGVESITPDSSAVYVLEVRGGTAKRYGWQIGDPVIISFDKD